MARRKAYEEGGRGREGKEDGKGEGRCLIRHVPPFLSTIKGVPRGVRSQKESMNLGDRQGLAASRVYRSMGPLPPHCTSPLYLQVSAPEPEEVIIRDLVLNEALLGQWRDEQPAVLGMQQLVQRLGGGGRRCEGAGGPHQGRYHIPYPSALPITSPTPLPPLTSNSLNLLRTSMPLATSPGSVLSMRMTYT